MGFKERYRLEGEKWDKTDPEGKALDDTRKILDLNTYAILDTIDEAANEIRGILNR